jgi:hypothetical protein
MDIQTIIVIAIVLVAAVYLIRKYTRAAKGTGGCGCGCEGGGCPAEKRDHCGDGK